MTQSRHFRRALAVTIGLFLPVVAYVTIAEANPAVVERVAPGGKITSVARTTAARGWPHAPTTRERRDVASIVVHTYTPINARGGTACTFAPYLGRVRCVLQVNDRVFRVTVNVLPDGGYRIGRRAGV